MKVGRNDLCPCGSGKKYKYCCLNNKREIEQKLTIPSAYDNCFSYDNMEEILNIFNEYNFEDLCRSVFAINSYIKNRCHYEFTNVLNFCLTKAKTIGTKQIKTFKEFHNFCNRISYFYKPSPRDDTVTDDFGQVKINIFNKFYKVIIGTGFNNTFAFYILCENLLNYFDEKEDIVKGFEFVDNLISSLEKENEYKSRYDKSKFYIPPENYFNSVTRYYLLSTFNLDYDLWKKVFSSQFIEQQHFIESNKKMYLIFNTSFLIDFLSYYIEQIEEDKLSCFIDISLSKTLAKNYDLDPDGYKVMFPISVSFEDTGKPYIQATSFLEDNGKCIVFISNKMLEERNIKNKYKSEILEKLKSGQLYIFTPCSNKKMKGRKINKDNDIQFIEYDHRINLREHGFLLIENSNRDKATILDLIHIITRTKNIEDFFDFFQYIKTTNSKFMNCFTGMSGIYEAWNANDHLIEQGSINFSTILLDTYGGDFNIFDTYKYDYSSYPFYPETELFSNPNCWTIKEVKENYYSYSNNAVLGYGGTLCNLKNIKIFRAHNVALYKTVESMALLPYLQKFDDLIFELFNHYKSIVSNTLNKNFLYQIFDIPFSEKERMRLNKITDEIYADTNTHDNIFQMRLAVDYEKLFNKAIEVKDRSYEISLLLTLLSLFSYSSINELEKRLQKDIDKPKICSVEQYNCDYIKDQFTYFNWPSNVENAVVNKDISQICKSQNIKTGKYKGQKAKENIRLIQSILQKEIEDKISNFNKIDLHIRLLSLLAQLYYLKKETNLKYRLCKKSNKHSDARQNMLKREEFKNKIRFVLYLIESNLDSNTNNSKLEFDDKDFSNLLSYGEWFVNLQDCGDEIHWNFKNKILHIDFDYKIYSLDSGNSQKENISTHKRIYENIDYWPNRDLKSESNILNIALSKDLGFKFSSLFNLIDYLMLNFSYTFKKSIAPDVYSINKEELLNDIRDILLDKEEIIEIEKALEFLIIDIKEIRITIKNGEKIINDLIPLWERENRVNRFDVKPLLQVDEKIIFSPPVMGDLLDRWGSAIEGYYPPFEVGLNQYRIEINKLLSYCQLQMEKDIYGLCKLHKHDNDICEHSFELYKRFPKENYPQELGDYDCIFIDRENKIIWNLESKFFHYVGSISEFSKHQDSFYEKDKKDKKFERRITYLNENYNKVLQSLSIPVENYKILSYMITNKVFVSFFKPVSFEIITFDEFSKLINKYYT